MKFKNFPQYIFTGVRKCCFSVDGRPDPLGVSNGVWLQAWCWYCIYLNVLCLNMLRHFPNNVICISGKFGAWFRQMSNGQAKCVKPTIQRCCLVNPSSIAMIYIIRRNTYRVVCMALTVTQRTCPFQEVYYIPDMHIAWRNCLHSQMNIRLIIAELV